MGREAIGRAGLRLVPTCAAAVLMLGSSIVMADEAAVTSDGLLHFKNVRVVNAPAPVATSSSGTEAGYRVYRDAGTGALRAPTAEEMQAVAGEQRTPTSNMQKSYNRIGATRVVLDDSFLQYTVVARQPDGSLAEICVTGADKANEVIDAASKAATVGEARNVR